MTRIDFYTKVADRLQTACTLCGKAVARQMRVLVLTPDAEATERMDRLLWTHPPVGFLPHVRAGHRLAGVTPIVVDHDPGTLERDDLLLNLRPDPPELFSRFQRLIEIVGQDEEDTRACRIRYRFYRDRGYEITLHDLGQTAPG
jgi:DNA polymerase III subunit chi